MKFFLIVMFFFVSFNLLHARVELLDAEQIQELKKAKILEATQISEKLTAMTINHPKETSIGAMLDTLKTKLSVAANEFEKSKIPDSLMGAHFGRRDGMNAAEVTLDDLLFKVEDVLGALNKVKRLAEFSELLSSVEKIKSENWIKDGLKNQINKTLQTLVLAEPRSANDVEQYLSERDKLREQVNTQIEASYDNKKGHDSREHTPQNSHSGK